MTEAKTPTAVSTGSTSPVAGEGAEPLPRVLVDFAVTPDLESFQQFVLDLAERGYGVRCSLWPESDAQRIWPGVQALTRTLAQGEPIEEVGIRLSHADSFSALPTPVRLGVTVLEEAAPRGSARQFNEADGLLVLSRTGLLRFRQFGVIRPAAPLSLTGFEDLVKHRHAPAKEEFQASFMADAALLRHLQDLSPNEAGLRIVLLADVGQDPPRARLLGLRVAHESVAQGLPCLVVCFAVQSGPAIVEDRLVVLGQHHLLPQYDYLIPETDLVNTDLASGIGDLLGVLPAGPERVLELAGRLPIEAALAPVLTEHGYQTRSREYPELAPARLRQRVAVAGPYNVPCGVAEEIRLLVQASPRPLMVLSERVGKDELVHPSDGAVRCYLREGEGYGALLREVLQHEIDVLHIEYNHGLFDPAALVPLVQQLRMLGVHTILTPHATTEDIAKLATEFDQVIVNTPRAQQQLRGSGVLRDHIGQIPLPARPLPQLTKREARSRLGIEGAPLFATCGFAFRHKGLIQLIEAAVLLARRHPDVLLLLCSPPYPGSAASADYLERCRQVVDEWDLSRHVRFLSEFAEMEMLAVPLQAADMLVFPYTHAADQDSSGAVRMALDAGRPLVVTDLPLFEDVREVAVSVPAGDVPALAEAIAALSAQEGLQRQLGTASRALARELSPEWIAERHWLEAYRAFGDVGVHLEGVFQSCDSFAHVLTNLARGLDAIGCAVSIDSWRPGTRSTVPLPTALEPLASRARQEGLTVRMSYPHRPESVAGDNRALVLPWETTLLPDGLADALNRNVEWVIAPSIFCLEVLRGSGVDPEKVVHVPHGIDPERFHPAVKPFDLTRLSRDVYYNRPDLDLVQDSLFVFLHLGAASKRKGTDVLLEAYLSEFTGHDPVLLIIKSPLRTEAEDWARREAERRPNAPRLLYLRDETPASLLPGYYTAAHCIVHPCRGEGFGLPILEAMACGRPAIVTNWSGPTDFCSAENAYLLPYTLVPAREFHVPVPPESLWAEPDLGHLRALLRHVATSPEEVRHKGTLAAGETRRWTWRHSALLLIRETRTLPESRSGDSGGSP